MWTLIFTSLLVAGGPPPEDEAVAPIPKEAQRAYADLLKRHVAEGRVDYKGIEASSLPALDRYLEAVAKATLPADRAARIGLLVDAYNALVIRSVIRHGRPRSVLDVKGFFDAETHRVGGKTVTLDALEKKVLNPFARDPRTHFVLVCGAVGCPILENRPYLGGDLEARFEAATRRFVASPAGARVSAGELAVSKIFDWYAADFGGKDRVQSFVVSRLSDARRAELGEDPRLSFIDYNWTLNQQ